MWQALGSIASGTSQATFANYCLQSGSRCASGRMSGVGQSRRFAPRPVTSDLPRSTDFARPTRLVRFVPGADIGSPIRSPRRQVQESG
jgi:hypothetical protein